MGKIFSRAALIATLPLLGSVPATAQDAFLTSRDGSISLEGTLLGFDGENYRLETEFGIVTVDSEKVACEGPGCPDLMNPVAEIRLSGDDTVGALLMPALIETFATRHALLPLRLRDEAGRISYHLKDPTADKVVARFHLSLSDTAQGLSDLMGDKADLAMADRVASPQEVASGIKAGIGDFTGARRLKLLALDALVPVVSPHNPVRRITLEQLGGVRIGQVVDWEALGGPKSAIDLHEPANVGRIDQLLPASTSKAGEGKRPNLKIRHESASGLADTVARSPEALGLVRFSEIGNTRPLVLVGSCGRMISVSAEALKAEDYPLPMPLYLYVPPRRLPGLAREFLEWLNSPAAEMAVRRAGFVDQIPVEIPLSAQGDRLANAISAAGGDVTLDDLRVMVSEMTGARRLTATFRFRDGSALLDPQSEGNLDRLARDIEIGLHDGHEIILAGFSDGQGAAAANRTLSAERAETVAAALREAAPAADWDRVSLQIKGFGEVLPLACDDDEQGRRINRRVEVWIR